MFPNAQFAIVGVLGPASNAHAGNEFLHLDYAKKLNCCVSKMIYDYDKNTQNLKK
jgi:hypothetical protein